MVEMNTIDWIAYILVVVGALNWGLMIWDFDLVTLLGAGFIIKTVYALIALSGAWMIYKLFK